MKKITPPAVARGGWKGLPPSNNGDVLRYPIIGVVEGGCNFCSNFQAGYLGKFFGSACFRALARELIVECNDYRPAISIVLLLASRNNFFVEFGIDCPNSFEHFLLMRRAEEMFVFEVFISHGVGPPFHSWLGKSELL